MRITGTIAGLAAAIALSSASAAGAATPVAVHCGQVITEDTKLANDLTNCPGNGLVIGAGNVDLDLNGHTVDGDRSGTDDVGIDVSGHDGTIVERGSVREFAEGVLVVGTRGVTLRDLTTSGQLHGGIHVLDSYDVVIDRNSARSNVAGIIVQRSAAVLVTRNSLSESEDSGIALFEVRHAQVIGNAVTTSRTSAGIGVLDGSTQNSIVRNRLWSNAAGVGLNNGASANVVEANTLSRNESGVIVDVGTHDNEVVRNRIEDSGFEGIAVVGSDQNLLASNRLARNGALADAGGIAVIPLPDDPSETSDGNSLIEKRPG